MLRPLSVFILLLVVLLLFGVKVAKRGSFHEDFLSLPMAKNLQGAAAVAVILHHLTQTVTDFGEINKGWITNFNDWGIFCTGVFFFFSGYGLYTSLITKEDYLKGFFRKRYVKLLVAFVVINLMFCAILLPMNQGQDMKLTILNILGLVLINNHMWYIVEICLLYLAFYLIFRNPAKRKYGISKMALVVVVMITVSLLLGHDTTTPSQGAWFHGEWWYNTTGVFIVGMIVAKYRSKMVPFVQKHYWKVLLASLVLFTVLLRVHEWACDTFGYWTERPGDPAYGDKFFTLLTETPLIAVFVLVLLILSMKLKFDNFMLRFLGKIALELYLSHNLFILLLGDKRLKDVVFYASVYIGAILLATLLHWIDGMLVKKISGIGSKKVK